MNTPPLSGSPGNESTPGRPSQDSAVAALVDAAIEAAAAITMEPLQSAAEIGSALNSIRKRRDAQPTISASIGGAMAFAMAAFPTVSLRTVYAQLFLREPFGRGAHFDVYREFLHPEFPWVALFNLAGDCKISVFPLPEDLSRSYWRKFGQATDEGYKSRRDLSEIARKYRDVMPTQGLLFRGQGLILPQRKDGLDWVHEIVPLNRERPGRFVKFLVPGGEAASLNLYQRGYGTLDSVITDCFGEVAVTRLGPDNFSKRRRCNLD